MDTSKWNTALARLQQESKLVIPDTLPLQRTRPAMQDGSMVFAMREAWRLHHKLQLWVSNRIITYIDNNNGWSREECDYAAIIDALRYCNGKIQT